MIFRSREDFVVLFIIFSVFSHSARAENWHDVESRRVSWKAGIVSSQTELDVASELPTGARLKYRPDSQGHLLLSGAYQGIGTSISLPTQLSAEEKYQKGMSSGFDWQFRLYFDQWSLDLLLQKNTGFYLQNTATWQAQDGSHPYIQKSDLSTSNFALGTIFLLNPGDFSMKSAMDQTAIQTASGWSWLVGGNIHGGTLQADSGLVPAVATGKFGRLENLREIQMVSAQIGGGIGGTWVPQEHYFVTGTTTYFYGQQSVKVRYTDQNSERFLPSSAGSFRVGAGFNSEQFIGGLTVQYDNAVYQVLDGSLTLGAIEAKLFAGSRF